MGKALSCLGGMLYDTAICGTCPPGAHVFVTLAVLFGLYCRPGPERPGSRHPTSIGLAEHGLMAFRDNWQYVYGGKGGDTDGDGLRGVRLRRADLRLL